MVCFKLWFLIVLFLNAALHIFNVTSLKLLYTIKLTHLLLHGLSVFVRTFLHPLVYFVDWLSRSCYFFLFGMPYCFNIIATLICMLRFQLHVLTHKDHHQVSRTNVQLNRKNVQGVFKWRYLICVRNSLFCYKFPKLDGLTYGNSLL
jgi:hypothetical protein